MMKLKTWVAALGLAASAGVSQAALVSLGDGTVKDTNTNLIWLADWSAGPVNMWAEVNAWAQGLNFAGSSDWVLPSTQQFVDLYAAYGDLTAISQFTNVIVSDY